ncbi:MAG: type IVB secretion system protein IcmX [Tatlockia sp.]|jgi:intracellular multiplication protein IcmX
MTFFRKFVLHSLFVAALTPAFAAEGGEGGGTDPQGAETLNDISTYLLNLGGYLGYNLNTSPTSNNNTTISQTLINLPGIQVFENYLFNTYLGALLVNSAAQGATEFVPSNPPTPYSAINAFANYTFLSPAYNSPSTDQVSVSSLIDQPTYQADPVSQAVLNILGTPDYSYCLNNDSTAFVSCTYPSGTLNEYQVMLNAIGTIPNTQTYFTYNINQPLLSQLNSNTLLAPMMYTTTSAQANSTSSGTPGNTTNQGLVATNQAQQAANFIRYAIGAMLPLQMPSRNEYDTVFIQAQNLNKSYTPMQQQQAQAILANYLAKIRIYAAQSSVGISNLYYIFSKRLPQSQSTSSSGQQTSQALSEFAMATWRLYNPDQSTNTQWLSRINTASSATVEKEMAVLLAEINYQMYLSRQQQERLLLTQTMLLMQNLRVGQPIPTLALPNYNTNSSSTIPNT